MSMKDIIDKAKYENGNRDIPHKDLTWYIVGRMDELYAQFGKQVVKCDDRFLTKVTFWKMGTILLGLLGSLAAYVLYH